MNPKLTNERLKRRAIVYLRQSSHEQVFHNQESQRRQYGLADQARDLGFRDVLVIDEDLGRTGSGLVERRGFQRLVAEVCTGEVGAVFCIEASRLARNGRDWHHLIWMCGLVGAVLLDFDGVYDPNLVNDRLLLGMKGEMAAFELSLLRQRSLEAIRQKARRGELQFYLPVGFCWSENGKMEMDPDRRIQDSIDLAFNKFTELGSVRQVTLWFRREKIALPAVPSGRGERRLVWKLPLYHTIWAILTNPSVRGSVRVRQDGSANADRGRAGTQDQRALQATRRMDGVDSRSSSRVHFLGAIREESSDDCGQRAHEITHGAKGGAGRTRPARRAVAMSAVRSDAARGIRKPPYARTLLLPRCTSECA